jgi:hypothetical protein
MPGLLQIALQGLAFADAVADEGGDLDVVGGWASYLGHGGVLLVVEGIKAALR